MDNKYIVTDPNTISFVFEDDKTMVFEKGQVWFKLIPEDTISFFIASQNQAFFSILVDDLEIDGQKYSYDAIADGALDGKFSMLDITQYLTSDETEDLVDEKIAELIADAPETLDTLKELADAVQENKELIDEFEDLVDEKIAQIDLTDYYTKSEIDGKNYLTEHQSLADYYTKEEVDNKNYLTEHQSLADYYTKGEIESKGYLTEHQSLNDYYTKEEIESKGYLTEHQSLENYYTKEEQDAQEVIIANVMISQDARISSLESIDHSQYLTEHQSLNNYYTKGEVDEALANIDTSTIATKMELATHAGNNTHIQDHTSMTRQGIYTDFDGGTLAAEEYNVTSLTRDDNNYMLNDGDFLDTHMNKVYAINGELIFKVESGDNYEIPFYHLENEHEMEKNHYLGKLTFSWEGMTRITCSDGIQTHIVVYQKKTNGVVDKFESEFDNDDCMIGFGFLTECVYFKVNPSNFGLNATHFVCGNDFDEQDVYLANIYNDGGNHDVYVRSGNYEAKLVDENALNEAIASIDVPTIDTSNYYTKEELDAHSEAIASVLITVNDRIKKVEKIDHSRYLTQHQSLNDYYTKSEVDEAINNIDIPEVDTSNFYTKSEVDEAINNIDIPTLPQEWVGTQAEFDAIAEKDASVTYYIVKED